MDEVVIAVYRANPCLWRAVDQTKMVLDIRMQSWRNAWAAKVQLRMLMKRQYWMPRFVITDRLANYGTVKREMMPSVEHRKHKGLNNRMENSHQPTRLRERRTKCFKSASQTQFFLPAYDGSNNLVLLRHYQVPAAQYQAACTQASQVWAKITSFAVGQIDASSET